MLVAKPRQRPGQRYWRMPENSPDTFQPRMVPQGQVSGVDYIVHISPAAYGRWLTRRAATKYASSAVE